MKRRDFLGTAGGGALLAGGVLAGCQQTETARPATPAPAVNEVIHWKLVTTTTWHG